jgi:CcmD family protein
MWYLFAAYAVFWGLTFAYVFTVASRQKRLEREIDTLRRSTKSE